MEIAAEISTEIIGRTELKAQVKIRQPKELTEVAADVTTDVAADILKKLKVLLIAVYY